MPRLFGYPIYAEPEEQGNGGGRDRSIINAEEASRSPTQPNGEALNPSPHRSPQRETNPYPRFSDSESDLHNCFIDFFGREFHEIQTSGERFDTWRNQTQRIACDVMDVEVDLGLGIGAGSGQVRRDSVAGDKETDPGRVEVVADLTPIEDDDLFVPIEEGDLFVPFDDDLFFEVQEEEVMLMADDEEVLQWESLQNDSSWESEPLQEEEVEEEEEEEEVPELRLPPVNNNDIDDDMVLMNVFDGFMDLDYDAYFLSFEENDGDYGYILAEHPFSQEPPPPPPPPPVIGTRPASKRVVDDLPVVEFTSEELGNGENVVCAICIGEVVAGEKVTRLPCGHYYHGGCIVRWLGMKNTCPVCRCELPTDDDLEYERNRRSQRLSFNFSGSVSF